MHETRREELDPGVYCAGARLESKVGVVEDDEADGADGADETVKSPDEEGDPEPVGGPKGRREETRCWRCTTYLGLLAWT